MGFAAAAPIIAAGIGATSSAASSGKGGGKGGSSSAGSQNQQVTNFAPFQAPAIGQVFDILSGEGPASELLLGGTGRDSLLQVPEQASGALSNALGFANDLIRGGSRSEQELRSFEELINSEIGREPFKEKLGDLDDLRDTIEATFNPFISRASALADEGVNPRAGELLLETARGDFVNANPFINALVGDVTTDAVNAARDAAIAGGSLETSAFGQSALREAGRVANQIRSSVFESERGRQETAKQALGQFDAQNAATRLNALIGGSNIASASFGQQTSVEALSARLLQATEQLRDRAIEQRGDVALQLANLPLAGLNAVGPLAQQFTELPFLPLSNFADIAFSPLGRTTIGDSSGTQSVDQSGRILGGSLLGAGLLEEILRGGGDTGDGPVFGPDLGPLATGRAPPVPSFGTSLLGNTGSNVFAVPGAFFSGGAF